VFDVRRDAVPRRSTLALDVMPPVTHQLLKVLDEAAELLKRDGESHWSTWLHHARASLESSDYSGIDYLLSAYGGMGSLNDFVLGQTQVDGKPGWKPGSKALNDRFDFLRSEAWRLATLIRKHHEMRDV
jgi:uncharacterized protein DUF6966